MRGLALEKSGKATEQNTWCPPLESACVRTPTLAHHVHRHHHQATQITIVLPCFSLANWRIRRREEGRKEGGTQWGGERMWEEFLKSCKFWKGCLCAGIIASHFENPTGPLCEVASGGPLWGMLLILILFHGCLETVISFSWPSLFFSSVCCCPNSVEGVPVSAHVVLRGGELSICGLEIHYFLLHHLILSSCKPWDAHCSPCRDKEVVAQRSWGISLKFIINNRTGFQMVCFGCDSHGIKLGWQQFLDLN